MMAKRRTGRGLLSYGGKGLLCFFEGFRAQVSENRRGVSARVNDLRSVIVVESCGGGDAFRVSL